jgi:prevent-host-death family protein
VSGDISVRELRNQTSAVLRRVEAGERLRVTVDRRPVAELGPLPRRSRWVPAESAWRTIRGHLADPALAAGLREALPDTTADL